MKISQNFTRRGTLCIFLFVGGNLGSGVCWWLVMAASAAQAEPAGLTWVAMALCGLAALISLPLMLIEREYHVVIPEVSKEIKRDG